MFKVITCFYYLLAMTLGYSASAAGTIDCSLAYGKPMRCEIVVCDEKQKTFLGTWIGQFNGYSKELSTTSKTVFRPYQNSVTYTEADCLRAIGIGDSFIIGHRLDQYPPYGSLGAKTETGLLITGAHVDGSPFLRTADSDGVNEYHLVYKNAAAALAVWSLTIPARDGSPEMKFTTVDGRDFTAMDRQKRNVVVTMSIGPEEKPIWEGVVTSGSHTLQK